VAAVAVSFAATAAADERASPVLVELFTSQGCSSCPPADRYASELARRDDVLVLSFHVNYWDYIGWKDPFATERTTARQHAYARAMGQRHVYTPQMVIGGTLHEVGSDVAAIERAVAEVAAGQVVRPRIHMAVVGGETLRIEIGAGNYDSIADVLLVRYDFEHRTEVPRGENAGHSLVNTNVVRHIRKIGSWSGPAARVDLDWSDITATGNDRCAVIVQVTGTGMVLAVTELVMAPPAD